MKLSLDEMLTDVDASQIPITEKSPLSLDRVIQKTISNCSKDAHAPTHLRRRFPFALVAAILVGLLATTALAATFTGYHLQTTTFFYEVSEDGKVLGPVLPDVGITLSISSVSPTGLEFTSFMEPAEGVEAIYAVHDYYLETQTDGGWVAVPMCYERRLHWNGMKMGGTPCFSKMDWTSIYGELAPGNYRIQAPFAVTFENGSFELHWISKAFIIEG